MDMVKLMNLLKALARTLIAVTLYGAITLGMREFSKNMIMETVLYPYEASSVDAWISWVQKCITITAGLSLATYFAYQILTSKKLFGAPRISDLSQTRIVLINWLSVLAHFAFISYMGFYVNGYGAILNWLFSIEFYRYYIYLLPVLVFSVLFWVLSRCLSNSCVYRYKRWQCIR